MSETWETRYPILGGQARGDEGILDTAQRIERSRPLTTQENIELSLAWAEWAEAVKRLGKLGR